MGLSQRGSRTRPHCSAAQLSNLIRVKKKKEKTTESRKEKDREKKSLLPKKKLQIPYVIRTAKLYSHYLLTVYFTYKFG